MLPVLPDDRATQYRTQAVCVRLHVQTGWQQHQQRFFFRSPTLLKGMRDYCVLCHQSSTSVMKTHYKHSHPEFLRANGQYICALSSTWGTAARSAATVGDRGQSGVQAGHQSFPCDQASHREHDGGSGDHAVGRQCQATCRGRSVSSAGAAARQCCLPADWHPVPERGSQAHSAGSATDGTAMILRRGFANKGNHCHANSRLTAYIWTCLTAGFTGFWQGRLWHQAYD